MSLNPDDFEYIRRLVYQRAAIALDKGKEYLIDSRLMRLARQEGFGSTRELVAVLRSQTFNHLHMKVVEAMTTNETSFFRDIHPFATLQKFVLPELIKRREAERTLLIWCAACSSGQEPYSIAMVLSEHFSTLRGWKVRLIATDISTHMLKVASEGCYSQLQVARGMPAPLLVKYFRKEGKCWQVKESLRRMVEFYKVNLAGNWPPLPKFDIIFLRNVLYYFDDETKKTVLGKVGRLMKPDSYLFLGATETPIFLDKSFDRVQFGKTICYKLRES